MNLFGFVFLTCFLVGIYGSTTTRSPPVQNRNLESSRAKQCTYGPTYWCKNITTAASCKAINHCIQTVWEHQTLPPDHTSICDTCLEMVKEARDQLLSNETQEEIKEVFEGSCKLLPIKEVAEACIKVVDDFIVELVDILASQMNPQVVCSVAGLCNNEWVSQLSAELAAKKSQVVKQKPDTCKGCRTVVKLLEGKFHESSRDHLLQNFVLVCGRMGSLSDACSNIVVKYFDEIYLHLEENLNPDEFCLMSGECSSMFHTHISDVEVRPLSNVGVLRIGEGQSDDLPCDLCKQLVQHLRDILVANTTEIEFKKVLVGICKQTGNFKDECLSLVNEYYTIIYNYLMYELNGTVICTMVGICQKSYFDDQAPIVPLLQIDAQNVVFKNRPAWQQIQINPQTKLPLLPIERVMPQTLTLIGNTQLCTFCEYFLHFVQQSITEPATEESIKSIVDKACDLLPRSVNETCYQFVETYGPAFIAILAQEIDPSVVCPKLSLCPSAQVQNVEIFMHHVKGDKPNCPLCLLALESLEGILKNKTTEANLRHALSNLCSHLHGTVAQECKDFVETYTDQIIEAALAHLTPTEICEYLHLCKDTAPAPTNPPAVNYGGNIETNEIPDNTENGVATVKHSPLCVMCEFVLTEIDKQLGDNATEEEIKSTVEGSCKLLPHSVHKPCIDFIEQYAPFIIQLLIQELDPTSVCTQLQLCINSKKVEQSSKLEIVEPPVPENVGSPQCILCKLVMTKLEQLLDGQITEDKILKALHQVCQLLPEQEEEGCNQFVEKYGLSIIKMLELAVQPSEVCSLMLLCSADLSVTKPTPQSCQVCEATVLVMDQILQNPNVDHEIEHVLEKTCRALPVQHQPLCRGIIELYGTKLFNMLVAAAQPDTVCAEIKLCPKKKELLGSNKCTWGPGYWCTDEASASKCGMMSHCQEKVWKNKRPIK